MDTLKPPIPAPHTVGPGAQRFTSHRKLRLRHGTASFRGSLSSRPPQSAKLIHFFLLFSITCNDNIDVGRYGYRGNDCRSNIFSLSSGEIIYFIGTVVVIFTKETHKQKHYKEHTQEIRW